MPNPSLQGTHRKRRASELWRVRRAWRVTSSVEVLWPGSRRAEDKKQGRASP